MTAVNAVDSIVETPEALRAMQARRSVSPKRLAAPGPTAAQLELVMQAALRAPDHGGLTPWRAIQIPDDRRAELAQIFAEEKQRRDPLASAEDLQRAREHALNAPTLIAFVVSPRAGVTVPVQDQWLAAGAALGNMLNALDALGFGAIMLSGDRCSDAPLLESLGLQQGERLAGFISAGTISKSPPLAIAKSIDRVWSQWCGVKAKQPQ
ncbi:nitroreductase [soil metagenome]